MLVESLNFSSGVYDALEAERGSAVRRREGRCERERWRSFERRSRCARTM